MRTVSQSRLHHITGARTPQEQAAVLRQIGVVPTIQKNGRLCVFERDIIDGMLGRKTRQDTPNWDAFSRPVARSASATKIPQFRYTALLTTAKKRAAAKHMDCTLTANDIIQMAVASDERCALTGIPFSFAKGADEHKAPFAPSLDRIDSCKGYTPQNTRLVCVAVNLAMNQWGEAVLREIATAYVKHKESSNAMGVA